MNNDLYNHDLEPDVDMPAEFIERQNRHSAKVSESANSFIPRRQFLKMSGIAGGGLVLAFSLSRSPEPRPLITANRIRRNFLPTRSSR
jgi:hypothetical protein